MSWDNEESSQDDLVRDTGFRQKLRRVRKSRKGQSDEQIYSDHSAGDTAGGLSLPGSPSAFEDPVTAKRSGWDQIRAVWHYSRGETPAPKTDPYLHKHTHKAD